MFDLFYDEACQLLAGKRNPQETDALEVSCLSARDGESE